jgi:hypothetical protein
LWTSRIIYSVAGRLTMASTLNPILISLLLFFWGVIPHFAAGGDRMEIASTAFKDGGKIPIQYVMPPAGGKNLSIPLAWKNAGNPLVGEK